LPKIATEPIIKEVHVDAQPDTVFAFFTEADKITRWLATEAMTDPRPGGINHQRHHVGGVDYLVRGEFVEVDRPRRVVFTWGFEGKGFGTEPGSSMVEVTLTPADGGGTHVRLVHSGLSEPAIPIHDRGWDAQMRNLADALATYATPGRGAIR
jgi:uncharacterized protein YndB with AHSA1/START domain